MNTDVKKATFFISMSKFIAQTMLFFWGIYYTQIGLTGFQQGILFAVFPTIGILSAIPIGMLNDRISSKNLAFLGYILNGLNLILISLVGGKFWALLAITLMGAFGVIITNLSIDSLFYKTGDQNQNKQIGNYVGSYLFAAGLGCLVGGLVLDSISIELWLRITGIFTILIGLLTTILPDTKTFKFELKDYKKDLSNLPALVFVIMIFIWALHMGAEHTSYGLLLKENFELTYREMGIYMGITIMAMLVWAKLAIHLIEKKWQILHILYLGLFLSGIGHFLMILPEIEVSFFGRLIHEAGDAFMFIFLYYGVRRLFPAERSGGMAGLINFTQMSAIIVGVLTYAPLGRAYGNIYPFLIGSGLCLLALIVANRFSNLIEH